MEAKVELLCLKLLEILVGFDDRSYTLNYIFTLQIIEKKIQKKYYTTLGN